MSCTPDNEFQHGLLGPLSPQLRGPPSRSPTTAQRRLRPSAVRRVEVWRGGCRSSISVCRPFRPAVP